MTAREFSQMCKSRGFKRMASGLYERCIGDGIYQTIYTGFRRYVDPSSPYYSATNRKSNYIDISVRSLYSYLSEAYFAPQRKCGGISPIQLKENELQNEQFHGIESQYLQMEEFGFDILDEVNTQEQLLKLRLKIGRSQDEKRIHNLDLADLFLITGQGEAANFELSHCLAHYTVGFWLANDQLLSDGCYEDYCRKLQHSRENGINRVAELWRNYLVCNYKEIHRYLSDNYQRNMEWIRLYGIPISDDFHIRRIPEKY